MKQIKIGDKTYKIIWKDRKWAEQTENYGEFIADQLVININKDLPKDIKNNTLLHEILHALWLYFRLKESDTQEKIVGLLSNGLMMVFKDNPSLRNRLLR